MKKQILTLIVIIVSAIGAYAQSTEAQNTINNVDKQFFIENKGQWPAEVLYATCIGGLDAWITNNGVLYDFYKLKEEQPSTTTEGAFPDKYEHKNYTRYGHRVWYKLQGNNVDVNADGKGKQEGYYNYLIGNDPKKHASNVGLYKEATVKNVYNGIDVRYYFDKGSIRYDYVVYPGADPSQITFVLEGTDNTYLNQEGNLAFNTRFGQVALAELQTYQNTKDNKVSSRFVKTENGWCIAIGDYDMNQTLIIDPLVYSTYLGGSGEDIGYSIALDASGNAYITGWTNSTNFDTTLGAYKTSLTGGYDVFVTKLNATGSALVYSTYLGGGADDAGTSIVIDASGNAYVTGNTDSTNYPTTSGAYQTSAPGGGDVFVTKLNPSGTALVYSTYLGGSSDDFGFSIALDAFGNAYVMGQTFSYNYDITAGAYQSSNGGLLDVFVTKLNTTGSALVYSTYLGGMNNDYGRSIAIDASGYAYVTGITSSTNYDITPGAYQTSYAGGSWDVFVTKLNTTGTALLFSTYLGGSLHDEGRAIVIDASSNVYVTGVTVSTDYDITSGAYQTSNAGQGDVFVTKLNPSGTALVYSTYLGGSSLEIGSSIVIDASGYIYVTGETNSTNYPTTGGAYQTGHAGNGDAFVTKLNATGSALVYSTFIGGSYSDIGNSIAIDASGYVYITGETSSTDYDITSGAYQTSFAGGTYDVFLTKLCLSAIGLSSSTGTDSQSVCINTAITNITYTTTNITGATVSGLPTGVTGSFATNAVTISGTPSASGKFNYTITLLGACGTITDTGSITVNPYDTISLSSSAGTDAQSVCINTSITNITYATTNAIGAIVTGLPAGVTGWWTANVVTISGTPSASGTFNYTVTHPPGGCGTDTAKGSITVGCVGIVDQANKQVLQLSPNPANTEVSIKGKFTYPILLEIIDASGSINQAVYSYDNHTIKLNVSSLTNGMYGIRIVDKGEVYYSKIIVQH